MQIEVYDKVWILEHGMPAEKIVFSVIESMGWGDNQKEKTYKLVNKKPFDGLGDNEGVVCHDGQIYLTKEDLIEHL